MGSLDELKKGENTTPTDLGLHAHLLADSDVILDRSAKPIPWSAPQAQDDAEILLKSFPALLRAAQLDLQRQPELATKLAQSLNVTADIVRTSANSIRSCPNDERPDISEKLMRNLLKTQEDFLKSQEDYSKTLNENFGQTPKEFEEAKASVTKTLLFLGDALAAQQKDSEAQVFLEKVLNNPDTDNILGDDERCCLYSDLAAVYRRLGKTQEADKIEGLSERSAMGGDLENQ